METVLLPVAAATVALGCWWAAVRIWQLPPFLLPAPPSVTEAYDTHLAYLLEQAAATLGHTLGGFVVATIVGVQWAVALAAWRRLRKALLPLIVALVAVPKVALAPLLVLWFGYGPTAKIALVALLCFFPIFVNTLTGLTSIPADVAELARSLRASSWHTLCKIRMWYAVPHLLTGMRVAVTLALIGAVVAEMNNPNTGLGAVILRSAQAANTPLAFAAVGLLALIGNALYYTVTLTQRQLSWTRHTTI